MDGRNEVGFGNLLFAEGIAFYGKVEVREDKTTLQLKIINDSEKKLVLKKIQLEPVSSVAGRVNVNTATKEVLASVLGSGSLAETIISNRPIGVKGNLHLGIGELFLLNQGFLALHNYLTVKSDVFEVICRVEYSPAGKTMAYQIIRTVLERGN